MNHAWLLLALAACTSEKTTPGSEETGTSSPTTPEPSDADLDGWSVADGDCDDDDPAIHPDAVDAPYDGVDADCAGDSDHDADGDGVDAPSGGGGDCDDANPDVHPGVVEVCNGVDDDCDDAVDGPSSADATTFYADDDGDGHGDPARPVVDCALPSGSAEVGDDCDDAEPARYPGAADVACDGLDNDCDPLTIEAGGARVDGVPAPSLADAFANAPEGAVVEICEGESRAYDLRVQRPLTVRGLGGSAGTVLNAHDIGPVLVVETTSDVTIEGLTLTGGLGRGMGSANVGGGIWVTDGAYVTASDLLITGNRAGDGAGLYLGPLALFVGDQVHIDANTADPTLPNEGRGGAVMLDHDSALQLSTSSVSGNTATSCAGLWIGDNGFVDGGDTTVFEGNVATADGGGGCAVADAVLQRLEIVGNEAGGQGGGLTVGGAVELWVVSVRANVATVDGGGLSVAPGGSLLLNQCEVLENEAATFPSQGGGVRLDTASLQSVDTDWGTAATDNDPADVGLVQSNLGLSWPGPWSFTCTDGAGGGCL